MVCKIENLMTDDISNKAVSATNEIFNNVMNSFSGSPGDNGYKRCMFYQNGSGSHDYGCTIVIDVEIEEDNKRSHIKTTFGKAN